MERTRLAAYVLTLNEERNVADAVRSLQELTPHVLVVDSGSDDGTAPEALGAGALVTVRPFDSFEKQRNFAIDRLIEAFDPEWILTIDADERLSPGLVDEIRSTILSGRSGTAKAYTIPRVVIFEGRILRHGGLAKIRLLRLYQPGTGRYESRSVNEHFAMKPGYSVESLSSPIQHNDVMSWERHIAKHNRYSTLEAQERAFKRDSDRSSLSLTKAMWYPYLRRRWLRENLWNRLPAKPLVRFLQMYILSRGFLDGAPGFDLALFQAWQELCTEQKFRELRSQGK